MKSWQDLISSSDRHCAAGFDPSGHELESHNVRAEEPSAEEEDFSRMRQVPKERFANGMLSLGMVGQPNAGKSSLINSLMGKRVVSVSKTPGHTKHFQVC